MTKINFSSLGNDFPEEEYDEEGFPARNYDNFQSDLGSTLDKLTYELERIGVEEALLEIDCGSDLIRKIRQGEFPIWHSLDSARVRLTFSHPELGPLQYPCSTYVRYSSNIRAITLTLEALRAIDRYGACRGSQQYEGFKGLPAGEEQEKYFADEYSAAEYVAELAGVESSYAIPEDKDYFQFCYKKAAKAAHPDSGGSDQKFQTLQQAKEVIERSFLEDDQAVA